LRAAQRGDGREIASQGQLKKHGFAPGQIQPQAVGFFFSLKKIKIGPKSEVPAVPCALKRPGLVRLRWLSAELFPLPIEHSLN
jgi:hypothetical protein